MELAVNDLEAHIQAKRRQRLNFRCIRSIAQQALSALPYLHEKNVTYRDLKIVQHFSDHVRSKLRYSYYQARGLWHLKLQIQASHHLRNKRIHGS